MDDEYQYEDDNELNASVRRNRIIIGLLILICVIALIFLIVRGCNGVSNNNKKNKKFNYENTLLEAGKKYFEYNSHELPQSVNECKTVTLNVLANEVKFVDIKDFSTCDVNATYVQVCLIDKGTYSWTPWLKCSDYNSDELYGEPVEGKVSDIKNGESLVSYKYLPQISGDETQDLGPVEEYLQNEIPYKKYKTLETVTYYSYKDEQWIWNTVNKYYFSAAKNEYYVSSPSSQYTSRDSATTVYKWYTESGQTKEYYNGYSATAPSGYPYKDEASKREENVYRPVLSVESSLHYYECKAKSTDTYSVHQEGVPCQNAQGKNTRNPLYTITVRDYYMCKEGYIAENYTTNITSSTKCYKFGNITSTCPAGTTCNVGKKVTYRWYKLTGSNSKKYYPGGDSNPSSVKVYYSSAPIDGAKADANTKTTGYKWYYTVNGQTSNYSSEAPNSGATKTNNSRFTDWSNWSTTKPATKSYRTIESQVKVKVQEIKNVTNNWENITTEYVTLDEMIKSFNDEGYDVKTINDISNNGELNYITKIYIRNKKENLK